MDDLEPPVFAMSMTIGAIIKKYFMHICWAVAITFTDVTALLCIDIIR